MPNAISEVANARPQTCDDLIVSLQVVGSSERVRPDTAGPERHRLVFPSPAADPLHADHDIVLPTQAVVKRRGPNARSRQSIDRAADPIVNEPPTVDDQEQTTACLDAGTPHHGVSVGELG